MDPSTIDNESLLQLAQKVKPVKSRTKKGKKFADTSFMMSIADEINIQQESKIQASLSREAEKLKVLVGKEKRKLNRVKKETQKERIEKTKEKLRNQKATIGKSRGDHRQPSSGKAIDTSAGEKSTRKAKRVSFHNSR